MLLSVVRLATCLAFVRCIAQAQPVPNAFSVEWQGTHPCEKLYEDAQIRIGRCIFAPGAAHLCHSHPGTFSYVLNGGTGETRDERGPRQVEAKTGDYRDSAPVPWHEARNTGDTTLSILLVEKKYQPVTAVDQSVCKSGQ